MVGRALNKGDTIFIGVFGTSFPLIATVTQPTGIVIISETTGDLVLFMSTSTATMGLGSGPATRRGGPAWSPFSWTFSGVSTAKTFWRSNVTKL